MKERDLDPARLFHLNSSNVRTALQELSPDPATKPSARRIHAGARRISLGGADFDLAMPVGQALASRRSQREFSDAPLPLETLGRLLYAAASVNTTLEMSGIIAGGRTYPSGGGLYPLEIYPVIQRVDELADGIYHYDPWTHELEEIRTGNFHAQFGAMTLGQQQLAEANVIFFIAAIFERTMWKYGQRGYRYAWLEAGHLGQNFYLAATALGLAPVALGGFFDAEANALLALGGEESAIYAICVGRAAG